MKGLLQIVVLVGSMVSGVAIGRSADRVLTESGVRLSTEEGRRSIGTEPGFLLTVEGWKPNGHISIYLIGPKGEQVIVVSKERLLQVEQEGVASFAVPYALRGLYPGKWQLVVAGESGIHVSTIVVPRVTDLAPSD